MPLQGSLTGSSEIVQHISFLLSQGGHDGHHSLDKEAAGWALCAQAGLAPKHAVTKRLFSGIVGWLDAFFIHERPQGRFDLQDFPTGSSGSGMGTGLPLPQKRSCADFDFPDVGL